MEAGRLIQSKEFGAGPGTAFDALVVGAGPAGSACAARLSERGWKVAVVDRAMPGRERVCGGFLGMEFENWIRLWGWSADLTRLERSPIRGVLVSGEGSRLVGTPVTASGFAVDRGVFDRWVADLAASRGARLWVETTAEALERTRSEVTAARIDRFGSGMWSVLLRSSHGTHRIQARHWIDATGRRPVTDGRKRAFFACKAEYEGVRYLNGAVALHFVERGHIGLNPLDSGRTTLCLCVDGRYLREAKGDLDAMMRRFEFQNANLRASMDGARRVSAWQSCQAEPDDDPVFYRDEKFRIGDALSMVNPVIGGGIPIAMQSGILLADLLSEKNRESDSEAAVAAEFERRWRRQFSNKFRFGRWLGRAERSAIASRWVMRALNAAPALLPRLVRMARPVPQS